LEFGSGVLDAKTPADLGLSLISLQFLGMDLAAEKFLGMRCLRQLQEKTPNSISAIFS